MTDFFTQFPCQQISLPRGQIRYRHGGDGPALLLLHGNPQTHAMWHKVGPELSKHFHIVCPDLRGYGGSHKPPHAEGHAAYAKREMALDCIELMESLGFDSFLLVGHDRGGRVSHRLAIDHPNHVRKLMLLDIIPTLEHFERADMAFGLGYYHWFWFAQPHPFPENLIMSDPETWFFAHTNREPKDRDFFAPQALEDYLTAIRDWGMVHGMCEDYRAAAGIDLQHDRENRAAQNRITCDLHVMWGEKGKIGQWYDAQAIWAEYCDGHVTSQAINTGHYLPEEDPDAVVNAIMKFFRTEIAP